MQRVLPPSAVTLPLLDLSTIDLDAREAVIQEVAADSAAQTFDLAHDVPWRAQLLRLASDDHALLLTIHHIAVDGWSVSVLLGEMAAVYRSEPALPPLALQYADVARWQRQWLDEGLLEPQLDYWIRTLDGLPPALALPTDHPRRPDRSRRAGVERFVIDAELAAGLARLGRTLDATTFMTLLAAFNVLLSRHAGQHDIAVGTPIANRTRPELEPLIGFFANTLVMRTRLDGDPDFAALVRRVRAASLGAYANQDVPFEQLVETLQPERSLDYTPLFQVLFVMQGASEGHRRARARDLADRPAGHHREVRPDALDRRARADVVRSARIRRRFVRPPVDSGDGPALPDAAGRDRPHTRRAHQPFADVDAGGTARARRGRTGARAGVLGRRHGPRALQPTGGTHARRHGGRRRRPIVDLSRVGRTRQSGRALSAQRSVPGPTCRSGCRSIDRWSR